MSVKQIIENHKSVGRNGMICFTENGLKLLMKEAFEEKQQACLDHVVNTEQTGIDDILSNIVNAPDPETGLE